MKTNSYIPIDQLCIHYDIEMTFFTELNTIGLLEIISIEQVPSIPEEQLSDLEKMIRLHREMNVNYEGIDVILHLLSKIELLQKELTDSKNRLLRFEND